MAEASAPSRPPALVALRRHPVLSAALVLLSTVLGLGLAASRPVTYTASTRLAVAGGDLSAQAVPGFALASQELAANYARYVDNAQAQGSLEREIGASPGSVRSVTASPVPESNVVDIEVEAGSAKTAVAAATRTAGKLVDAVDSHSSTDRTAQALSDYTSISNQVAAAQQAANDAQAAAGALPPTAPAAVVSQRRQAAASAVAQLAILQVQQEALSDKYRALVSDGATSSDLTVVQPAVVSGDDRSAQAQRFGLLGAVVGAALALVASTLLERRRPSRLTSADEAHAAQEAPARVRTPPVPVERVLSEASTAPGDQLR